MNRETAEFPTSKLEILLFFFLLIVVKAVLNLRRYPD